MPSGILLRVGIDLTAGKWNAPCRKDRRFVYVPVPGGLSDRSSAFDHHYSEFEPFAAHLGAQWPSHLNGTCHLDPDFAHLTYGDGGGGRGTRIRNFLSAGDFIVFWAGLRNVDTGTIDCAIIGYFTISCVMNASDIGPLDAHRNAHTRYVQAAKWREVVVFANPQNSGRLRKCIPIGGFRDKAQRVDRKLLATWGGLEKGDGSDWPDGYITRSGQPPIFRAPRRFLKWFKAQKPKLVHANNV
jgi:hypothetical protein